MRIPRSIIAGFLLFSAAACKRDSDSDTPASGSGTSVLFGNASPEAREALAARVDYRLTDDNFARWEAAQRNLDRLPASAIPAASAGGSGDVIDRAVGRLESSPRARTAIEATGLTVRDFVLQTIALAQAAEAVENPAAGTGMVPAGNLRFVARYRQRVAPARTARSSRSALADSQAAQAQETGSDTLASRSSTIDSSHVWLGQSSETQRRADSIEAARRLPPPPPPDTATGDSAAVD
jgi:hypothetical protein